MKNILYKIITLAIIAPSLINAMVEFQQGLGAVRENISTQWNKLTPTQQKAIIGAAGLGTAALAAGAGTLGYYLTKETPGATYTGPTYTGSPTHAQPAPYLIGQGPNEGKFFKLIQGKLVEVQPENIL